MKTAVIYARYSSNSQSEQSIEGQLTVCNKFAQDNNIAIVKHYIDRAMTGTNDNRFEFQQMLKDSETANWDIVLVYAIDRFGRNSIEVALNKQKLKKNNKTLISATQRTSENIDGTKNLDGILLENVYIGIAEYYSAELSQKVLRGLQENRKKGYFCGGKLQFGYKVIDKKVLVEDNDAEVVKHIFTEYSNGSNVVDIVNYLNNNGYTRTGEQFTKAMVYGILRSEKYLGIYRIKNEVFENIYPQIIPNELFRKVQKRIDQNKVGKNSFNNYLLRNKVTCGYCGHTISAECGKSNSGYVIRYYKCVGRKKYKNNCEKTTVRKEALEQFVLDCVIKHLSESQTMEKIIDGIMKAQTDTSNQITVNNLTKERTQKQRALDNLTKAIEDGIYSSTTNKRLNDLETEIEELNTKIAIEQSKQSVIVPREKIKEFYADMLKLEPQILINNLIQSIVLYNDRIVITYNNPISPDESRGLLLYTAKSTIFSTDGRSSVPVLANMDVEIRL